MSSFNSYMNKSHSLPLYFQTDSCIPTYMYNDDVIVFPLLVHFFHIAKHRKIRLIEVNAKWHHLKKFTCKGTLRLVFICLRPRTSYPPLTHCIRVCSIRPRGWWGESWTREKVRGTITKLGRKYKHDWLYLQSIKIRETPAAPFTDQFFYDWHFALVSVNGNYLVYVAKWCQRQVA